MSWSGGWWTGRPWFERLAPWLGTILTSAGLVFVASGLVLDILKHHFKELSTAVARHHGRR